MGLGKLFNRKTILDDFAVAYYKFNGTSFGTKSSPFHFSLIPFYPSSSISERVNIAETKEELITHLKKNNVSPYIDLNEKTIEKILDRWPDFFEDNDVSIWEGEEKRVNCMPLKIKWTQEAEYDVDVAFADFMRLLDAPEKKEKKKYEVEQLSYKQMQRMRAKNSMWKPPKQKKKS